MKNLRAPMHPVIVNTAVVLTAGFVAAMFCSKVYAADLPALLQRGVPGRIKLAGTVIERLVTVAEIFPPFSSIWMPATSAKSRSPPATQTCCSETRISPCHVKRGTILKSLSMAQSCEFVPMVKSSARELCRC